MKSIDRIQGTDGVRAKIAADRDLKGADPFQFFVENALITPAFCELYACAWAELLKDSGMADENDAVVIGWDPRDAEGLFVRAALDGVRKAGLKAIAAGMVPTPAVPLRALFLKAAGAMVLTASHNPSDQNGIKLFHGFSGLKFLPEDDKLLTRKLRELRNLNLTKLPLKGALENHSPETERFFIDFCRDPLNSWMGKEDFPDSILVIDASKGAAAGTVKEIFSGLSFKRVIYTNLEGKINENCGVADIEGRKHISYDQVMSPGAPFYSYEALTRMFQASREFKDVRSGAIKLIGLVFDGDADRCFRLDYNPVENRIIVSSGDMLGARQAEYLSRESGFTPGESLFLSTVESDLNMFGAVRKLGYRTETTGVGDKWILLRAILDMIKSETSRNPLKGDEIRRYLKQSEELARISGLKLSLMWKNYLEAGSPLLDGESDFAFKIGVEESGHCVTSGFFRADGRLNRCLIGNGIKSGLNSLAADESNYKSRKPSLDRLEYLGEPFAPGIRETFYIYHVDKSRLLPGSKFREKLSVFVRDEFGKFLPEDFSAKRMEFGEERDMLYWRITKANDILGAVFARNSGTEDKSALYLRGDGSIYDFARPLADSLHLYLLSVLKDMTRPSAKAELEVLFAIADGISPDFLAEKYSDLPFKRLLKEMELQQGLIERGENKFKLTEKGTSLLEKAKKSYL